MLYDYAATTAFELSVAEADVVTVVEGEDDAGWCKVSTRDGRVGLVPASYLQLDGAAEEQEQEEGQQGEFAFRARLWKRADERSGGAVRLRRADGG